MSEGDEATNISYQPVNPDLGQTVRDLQLRVQHLEEAVAALARQTNRENPFAAAGRPSIAASLAREFKPALPIAAAFAKLPNNQLRNY